MFQLNGRNEHPGINPVEDIPNHLVPHDLMVTLQHGIDVGYEAARQQAEGTPEQWWTGPSKTVRVPLAIAGMCSFCANFTKLF